MSRRRERPNDSRLAMPSENELINYMARGRGFRTRSSPAPQALPQAFEPRRVSGKGILALAIFSFILPVAIISLLLWWVWSNYPIAIPVFGIMGFAILFSDEDIRGMMKGFFSDFGAAGALLFLMSLPLLIPFSAFFAAFLPLIVGVKVSVAVVRMFGR